MATEQDVNFAIKDTVTASKKLCAITGKGIMGREHAYHAVAERERLIRNATPGQGHQDALRPRYRNV